jgi:SHR-binding domain of vacuolar-sorting associated protein 13
VSLQVVSASKRAFQIVHKESGRAEQLSYSVSPLPGLYSRTKLVTIMPQFVILNCLEEPLEVRQQLVSPADGSSSSAGHHLKAPQDESKYDVLRIEPFEHRAWHKTDHRGTTKVHIR